jgi:hypothetical protein
MFFLQNIQNVCISNPINTTLTDGSKAILAKSGYIVLLPVTQAQSDV